MFPSKRTIVSGALFIGFALPVALPAARADELSDVQRLYHAGQSAAAIARADQFLVSHPKDAPMRFVKAVMLADAKRSTEAIELFTQLTQDHPDLAEPYNNLAALYAAEGDYARAQAALAQALRTNPTYATAHENLGDVYAALAAQSYSRALKLEPDNASAPQKLKLVRELYTRSVQGDASVRSPEAAGSMPAATR
ncbi:MAG: tetratricopeptide repeat protein [Burkholderiaceae bacterium]